VIRPFGATIDPKLATRRPTRCASRVALIVPRLMTSPCRSVNRFDVVQEVLVGDVARRGVDAADVDHRVLPEVDARAVDEVDIAVREDRAVDHVGMSLWIRFRTRDFAAGLHEPHRLVTVEVERVVVDDRAIARRDRRVVARRGRTWPPVDDLLALGPASAGTLTTPAITPAVISPPETPRRRRPSTRLFV
jgi:hypothetical protein